MASISSFEKSAWFFPEYADSMLWAACNWELIKGQQRDEKHTRKDLVETGIAVGSYVVATYFYPKGALPAIACLTSTISPNATRWGTGTYLFLTCLKDAWIAWKGGNIDAVVKSVAWAVFGYIATTPTPTILLNKIVHALGGKEP